MVEEQNWGFALGLLLAGIGPLVARGVVAVVVEERNWGFALGLLLAGIGPLVSRGVAAVVVECRRNGTGASHPSA